MTAVNGGTAFSHRDQPATGAARWISLDVAEVSLQPGEDRIVPFTIAVPSDVPPGQHVAGLVAEAVPSGDGAKDAGQFTVQTVHRAGVAVVINVPGIQTATLDITGLGMREQDDQVTVFKIAVRNTGNVMVRGQGTLRIADLDGTELASFPLELGTVLPGDATFFYTDHPVHLADGDYLLGASLNYLPVTGDQEGGAASVANIELEIRDGQPRASEDGTPFDPSAQTALLASSKDEDRSFIGQSALYGVAVGVITLGALGSMLWRRGSRRSHR